MKNNIEFDQYSKEVENANNKIVLKEASTTSRTGAAKFRDKLVFGKVSWNEAFTYLGIIQTTIIFFGLMDDVIVNVNEFLSTIGIGYQFPVKMSIIAALGFMVGVIIFGVLAVRHIGTYKSSLELGTKMNVGVFLLWEQNNKLIKEVEELKKKVDGENENTSDGSSRVHRK